MTGRDAKRLGKFHEPHLLAYPAGLVENVPLFSASPLLCFCVLFRPPIIAPVCVELCYATGTNARSRDSACLLPLLIGCSRAPGQTKPSAGRTSSTLLCSRRRKFSPSFRSGRGRLIVPTRNSFAASFYPSRKWWPTTTNKRLTPLAWVTQQSRLHNHNNQTASIDWTPPSSLLSYPGRTATTPQAAVPRVGLRLGT